MVPVQVIVLNEMPLTAVNKIFKPALREKAIAQALTDAIHRVCGPAAEVEVEVRPHPKLGLESRLSVVLGNVPDRSTQIALTEAELGRLPVHRQTDWSSP